jgi:thiamine kinase-like enzyme
MENKEDIDYTIKQRLEIVKIEERQKMALKELDNLIAKIEDKNMELQALREAEEKCLVEIEKEAEGRVEMAMRKLTSAGQFMADLEGKATLTVSEVKNRSKQAQDAIVGLLGRVKELVDSSDHLKERSEEVMNTILKAEEDLHEKIKTNSEFEKILKKREEEVKTKNQEADNKLRKAKDLAFWHKKPGVEYKES